MVRRVFIVGGVRRAVWREARRGGSRGGVGWWGMRMGVGVVVVVGGGMVVVGSDTH